MKFIARKGAPDIPLELIEAQENDELVFFCGAGVAYPAGLPDFKGLVESVYRELPEEKTVLETRAIRDGYYDRALGLLEKRKEEGNTTGINLVRREIIKQLTIDETSNLETHKSLLQLSKTKAGGYRLVTTNVDHGFIKTEIGMEKHSDSAPTLPVSKPHKWSSIVHLHGLIDEEKDKNGEHLVFTSGDFGSAYLTERWASKFVTELFMNFTVVFVGYSLNDPVIRYMTDAIAAERRQGNSAFNQAYVIADSTPKNSIESSSEWLAKGVEPILYQKGGKNHSNLHNSLKAWAAHSRDGMSGKERIIKTKGVISPLPPYDNDESVKQVIDTLKERVDRIKAGVTGHPAKVFSEMSDPPAPIEWLPVLDKEGLLSIASASEHVKLRTVNYLQENIITPNKISYWLWGWLLHHLEEDSLICWIIDGGICLHPEFLVRLELELSTAPPPEPYLTFWRIMCSGSIRCCNGHYLGSIDVINSMIEGVGGLNVSGFSRLLEPSYEIKRAISWGLDEEPAAPFSADVVIGLKDWELNRLQEDGGYPGKYISLLGIATEALRKCMDLLSFVGKASAKYDHTHIDIVSIQPHEQNHRFDGESLLIELCRDLWDGLFDEDRDKAFAITELWKSYPYPIFRRLTLYAYANSDVTSDDRSLEYLISERGWWLWSVTTGRENFRLLHRIWPTLGDEETIRLLDCIVAGPPREMYRADLSQEDFKKRFDHERWVLLSKLKSFGRELFGVASELLVVLSEEYPEWSLQEGERDEFSHWSWSERGNKSDITIDELFSESVQETVRILSEDHECHEGRIDIFRYAGKEKSQDVISTLRYMHRLQNWSEEVWHAGLVGLADNQEKYWVGLARLVDQLPDEMYSTESWAVAWWARKAVSAVEAGDPEERYLWSIARRMVDINEGDDIELDDNDAVGRAINNPIGIVTQAILDRFGLYQIEPQAGLPKPEPYQVINKILTSQGASSAMGRVLLFSRLGYFYSIDPEWTQEAMLPLLNFEECGEAHLNWQGYLWSPRVTADLAIDIKENLMAALGHIDSLGESSRGLVSLFAFVCLQYLDLYKPKEKHRALISVGNEGRRETARFINQSVRDSDQEERTEFWENRVKPFIKYSWPKGGEYQDSKISEYFALMALQLDDSFPDAVSSMEGLLCSVGNMYQVISLFEESGVIEVFPREAFSLFSSVFTYDDNRHSQQLRVLLERFGQVEPDLEELPSFRSISDFLTAQG